MPKPISSRSVSAAQVLAYAKKAQEFTDAAISELNAGRFTSACSLAVHAGISAADAVCGARVGQRAAGKEHNQVLVLLGKAGRDGAEIERELGRLLPLKTNAEYEPAITRLRRYPTSAVIQSLILEYSFNNTSSD